MDEAWTTGTQLAESVVELLRAGQKFTRENLERTYVERRRRSWVEKEGRVAEHARDGFQRGVISGLIGMGLAGMTGGRVALHLETKAPHARLCSPEQFFASRLSAQEFANIRRHCTQTNTPLHDAVMEACGWPAIPFDGKLLITHQDALLMGGKVQAPAGYADHVSFRDSHVCELCGARTCIEICSGQAITPGENGVPAFDREKCVHCGACLWNCSQADANGVTNLEFRAGAGGLHSAQN